MTVSLSYLGHATIMFRCHGVNILTDPVLSDRVLHLRRRNFSGRRWIQEQPKPDIILLSHLHLDHLHLPSLRRFPKDVPLIVPRGSARWLSYVINRPLIELGPGDDYVISGLTIHVTYAEHGGNMPIIGLAQGYMLKGARTIYFPGDTDVFPQMSELANENIDLALIPIWGWGPTLGAGHLDPKSAAEAVALLRPKHVIPIHWASFRPIGPVWELLSYLHTPGPKFTYYIKQLAPTTKVHFLEPGQVFTLPEDDAVEDEQQSSVA
jgi:L-ascorbate metabolism protein UlaG (beta-lactamase superfamily)